VLSRREFVSRATVTLLLVPVAAACGSNSGSGAAASGGDGGGSCTGLDPTSSVVDDHTHTVCVPSTDLESPPSAGATYTTSPPESGGTVIAGALHTVTLTAAQLSMIQAGQSLTVTTSTDGGHDHQFVLTMDA
jgi:hypothetical protein